MLAGVSGQEQLHRVFGQKKVDIVTKREDMRSQALDRIWTEVGNIATRQTLL
jgi:hypothetical protein